MKYSAKHHSTDFRRRSQGSALLLVLFAIILLTGLITATVGFVKNDVDEYGAMNKQFRARQLAESGLAFGIHPQVKNEDRSLLEQQTPDGGRFKVKISSESTKLNANFILQAGRDDLLENLFVRWGVAQKVAKRAVEGLRAYLSNPLRIKPAAQGPNDAQAASPVPDDQGEGQPTAETQANPQGTNGAQSDPKNPNGTPAATPEANDSLQQFAAVEEMSLVREFGPVMEKQPDWTNFFTIWGDGKIDVNLADADTIALITGVTAATANQFVKYLSGPDGKPFTLDDRIYNNMDEVRAALGMSPEKFQLVEGLLSLNSAVDRIESTGNIAGFEKRIVVITSRSATPIRYLSWQEE